MWTFWEDEGNSSHSINPPVTGAFTAVYTSLLKPKHRERSKEMTYLLLCCSSRQCSGRSQSPSHDASPRPRAHKGSASSGESRWRWGCWDCWDCWDWSRAWLWVRVLGSSRAPCWGADRSWRGLQSFPGGSSQTTWGPIRRQRKSWGVIF